MEKVDSHAMQPCNPIAEKFDEQQVAVKPLQDAGKRSWPRVLYVCLCASVSAQLEALACTQRSQNIIRTSGLQTVDALIVMRVVCFFFAFPLCVFVALSGGVRFLCVFVASSLRFLCAWGARGSQRLLEGWKCKNLRGVAWFVQFLCVMFAFSLRFLCAWGARGSKMLWEGWTCKKPRKCCMCFLVFSLRFFAFSLNAGGLERFWDGWKCKIPRRCCMVFACSLRCFACSLRFVLHLLCLFFACSLRLVRPRLWKDWKYKNS